MERIASGRARALLGWLACIPASIRAVASPRCSGRTCWRRVRASLRTGLAALRRELGEPAAACIAASRTAVGIEDRPDVWIDAREFDRLLAARGTATKRWLCAARAAQ